MQIRFGYELVYRCAQPVPMILMLEVHASRTPDLLRSDRLTTVPAVPLDQYIDGFGNRLCESSPPRAASGSRPTG